MKDIYEHMKDSNLKLRIMKILWSQGYHCPIEVDLSQYYSEEEGTLRRGQLTDIDVLGIRFEPDLRMTTIIADCKSGRESEPNRVFWLRGVMDFFDAKEGIFIKKVLRNEARAIAPKLGIRVLDEKGLDILENSLGSTNLPISFGDAFSYSNKLWGVEIEPNQKPTKKQLALKSVYHYLQYQYWMIDEYKNIQTLIDSFSRIKSQLYHNDIKSKYLVYIGLQRLVLSIIKMASSIASRDLNNIRIQSQNYLFGDAFSQNERKRIISLLNMLAEHNNIAEKVTLEPLYFDELVEIVNRIIVNSLHATKMLQHLDVIIMAYISAPVDNIEKMLGASYSTDTIVLIKRIATFFQKSAEFEEGLFEELKSL